VNQNLQNLRRSYSNLLLPNKLWSRAEILSSPCPVPRSPGVYAWYFKQIPPHVPIADCLTIDGLTLLYIGISPKAPPMNGRPASRQTLRSRLRYHMCGNAEGSTLRLTIGCLLSKEIGLELRRVGSGKRLTFCQGEQVISEWLAVNAFVTWDECANPWVVEENLIRQLVLPLNLDQNDRHPFSRQLSEIRRVAREHVRQSSVWHPRTTD
jgi:hypothetical protein